MTLKASDFLAKTGAVRNLVCTPCDVATLLLRELKDNAETHLHGRVTDVVIAVPNDCGITDRQTILQAAEQAGLATLRLIPAGSAAALHFAATHPCPEGRVLTVDVGSGMRVVKQTSRYCEAEFESRC